MVSLVVVAANEVPVSVGNADSLRDQPDPGSRHGAWQTRSSIIANTAGKRSGVRRVDVAADAAKRRCRKSMVAHERCVVGPGHLGFGLRAARAVPDSDSHRHCDQSSRAF